MTFLTVLIAAKKRGAPLSNEEIAANMMTVLMAGRRLRRFTSLAISCGRSGCIRSKREPCVRTRRSSIRPLRKRCVGIPQRLPSRVICCRDVEVAGVQIPGRLAGYGVFWRLRITTRRALRGSKHFQHLPQAQRVIWDFGGRSPSVSGLLHCLAGLSRTNSMSCYRSSATSKSTCRTRSALDSSCFEASRFLPIHF